MSFDALERRGPGAWSRTVPQRFIDVDLPHPNPSVGRVKYQSLTSSQWAEVEELGRKIQGSSPQVVGVASIVAYAHGDRELLEAVVPEQLALIDAHVAAETAAGRQPASWLLNSQINRARIG